MSDETIPQDLYDRAIEACRIKWSQGHLTGCATHGTNYDCNCGYDEAACVVRDAEALRAPKDPAEVGVKEFIDCCNSRQDKTCEGRTGPFPAPHGAWHVRAAYAERERATRALSDWLLGAYPPEYGHKETVRRNTDVRRLFGWDRER